jgi:hypothetical protein
MTSCVFGRISDVTRFLAARQGTDIGVLQNLGFLAVLGYAREAADRRGPIVPQAGAGTMSSRILELRSVYTPHSLDGLKETLQRIAFMYCS